MAARQHPVTVGRLTDTRDWHRARWPLWLGGLAWLIVVGLGAGSLGALLWRAPAVDPGALWHDPYLGSVLRFTLTQATLSSVISLGLAIPVAVALARRPSFPGRRLLLRAMELSLVIPTLIALFGLVAVHGRQGWLAPLWRAVTGEPAGYLYGLSGIVLAHVFYNLPLAARLMLQALERQPEAHWRLAAQLGMTRRAIWRCLEWPALRRALPRLAALVFTLCFTSFAIVMTLGGGPRATTLEVALYQALKFEGDLGRAALLALTQLAFCLVLWAVALHRGPATSLVATGGQRLPAGRWWRRDALGPSRLVDAAWLAGLALLLLPPLGAVVIAGLGGLPALPDNAALWSATGLSLVMALTAAFGGLTLAVALLLGSERLRQRGAALSAGLMEGGGQVILILPAMVLGTGLFLLLRPSLGGGWQGYALVVLVNAFMALPFAMQVLQGALLEASPTRRRLADQLGIPARARWRWLVWPRLRRPLGLALAYAMTLSLGDFGVVALFGSPSRPTLPMLLYQQLGGYRWQGAAATALMLLVVVVAVFALLDRLSRRRPRYPQSRYWPTSPGKDPESDHA
ncbi:MULTISPECIES: thiamine/thiamine pyrophosphate ABC transporter permease [unclassified Modicisalibacter]|uniref:thiamine/thiamine pyrophosphate ABC transporter permease n=1 Tax=unclassified Modicisalibacter TaxID=2679913 RepID=UPI001CCB6E02|nr:thiamine/thiamine pyrophosphate ABC transporter permease [Modicisalibacter sp. R2A 31.J]MBZ9573793.1 thiamine/thiamine pyrophosphate ABC transporter permease [Modicisalibacter sp. MOD 31.J]